MMRQTSSFIFLALCKLTCISGVISLSSCGTAVKAKLIPFNDVNISYEGRISFKNDAAELAWSGTAVTLFFEGTAISAILKDADTANYFNVIIDDAQVSKIHTDTTERSYELATGLKAGKHKVQLFKRTEWAMGKTWFYGFETPGETQVLPPAAPRKRRIEFYGNSITCGYGVEDSSGNDSGQGYFENGYLSYAAITARHFDAQSHYIARSGIGIMISWNPLIMPEMYDRLDATDSTSKWDFSRYTPDIVIVDLFQNDSWLVGMPHEKEFRHRFGDKPPEEEFIVESYANFIKALRSKYPEAHIICTLGNMDATRQGAAWPGYVSKAVEPLGDKKIYTHFFPYKNTPGHPTIAEQRAMASDLIEFIEGNIKW
jgi:Carbohydrate esterase 2 N-terminal/GDSL-like Lipase/Acylhydrolase family